MNGLSVIDRRVVGALFSGLVLLAAVLLLRSGGEALAQDERAGCYPHGAVSVIEGDRARVFLTRTVRHHWFRRTYRFEACAFETGEPRLLDDDEEDWAFFPPAMYVSGTVVGWARQFCRFRCFSSVLVEDLGAEPSQLATRLMPVRAGPQRYPLVKVGSLRMQRNGAVAWIACRDHVGHESVTKGRRSPEGWGLGGRAPNCIRERDRRRGDRNYVMRLTSADDDPRIIDWGRIEPGSMRLAGDRISWIKIIRGRPVLRRATLR